MEILNGQQTTNNQSDFVSQGISNSPSNNSKGFSESMGGPKQMGITGLIMAIASLFIIPYLGIVAVVSGVFGIFYSIKQKAAVGIFLLNIGAVVLGFTSFAMSQALK